MPVPPPAPPPPSASKGGGAPRAGDALLLQRCEPALAAAQQWQLLEATGQLKLRRGDGLCLAAVPPPVPPPPPVGGPPQLELAPCATNTHDRVSFNASSGQVDLTYPIPRSDGINTSCITAPPDGTAAVSLSPCGATGDGNNGLWFNEELGFVHRDGFCLTAAWDVHPAPPPAPPPPPVEIFFRGRYNVEGIIGTLTEDDGLGSATDIVIGGCSSGGVAVFSNADHIHSLLPKTARIAATANSGYYLNINAESWVKPPMIMANLTSTLSPECVKSAQWRLKPWFCIVAEVAAPFIEQMPIFAWESRYDANQLGWSCPECGSSQNNLTAVNEYGKRMSASLQSWLAHNPKGAAFEDSCHRHCGCSTGITADDDGTNPKQAFAKWYQSLWADEVTPGTAPRKRSWQQSHEFPCTSCCVSATRVPGVSFTNDTRAGWYVHNYNPQPPFACDFQCFSKRLLVIYRACVTDLRGGSERLLVTPAVAPVMTAAAATTASHRRMAGACVHHSGRGNSAPP